MSEFYSNSVFWVDSEKIRPNPYQPRREFDQSKLADLAESIRQYGILQPLVVTRYEIERPDGGLSAEYELIAGERRLRASKLAGLLQVPVIIREAEDRDQAKLEIAIIENLQREDLNPVDRARAFRRLVDEFDFNHEQIGKKIGKSRMYVSNTLRILALPEEMLDALTAGKITEGHTRPLLMLSERPQEQHTLFREIVERKMTVREAEKISRHIAVDRVRKMSLIDPEMRAIEEKLSDTLGTRVSIEKDRQAGGKLVIRYFSNEDLQTLLSRIAAQEAKEEVQVTGSAPAEASEGDSFVQEAPGVQEKAEAPEEPEDDLYSIKKFSI